MSNPPPETGSGGRRHLVLDPSDNVTTLLDDRTDCEQLQGGGLVSLGVPFGHKAALRSIAAGVPVIKYGVVIGVATTAIETGEHVHVHNCH